MKPKGSKYDIIIIVRDKRLPVYKSIVFQFQGTSK